MIDPLASPPPVLSLSSTTRVTNVQPTTTLPYRLAIIGECPSTEDEAYGIPFVGAAGKLLDSILGSAGITRSACFIGNLCKYRPPNGDIFKFGIDHPKVLEGFEELKNELALFKPNCTLLLGMPGTRGVHSPLLSLARGASSDVTEWNGSIISTVFGKSVPAIHPQHTLRKYSTWPLLRFFATRARAEADSPELILPRRNFELDLSAAEVCARLDNWPAGLPASIDIEGGLDGWICLSVVPAINTGFIIAFGSYTDEACARVYVSVSRFLYRLDVPKVLQNSLYEGFVLGYGFNMIVRNIVEDTMLKGWEVYPELPKGLMTLASIWTREPLWKYLIAYSKKEQERRAKLPDYSPAREIRNKHLACCLDSAVTLEICGAQDGALSGDARRHYRLNMELLQPLLYMELQGIAYDSSTARNELGQVTAALAECATRLELRAGESLLGAKGSISTTKLKRVLYAVKGYPEQKKGRGEDAKATTDVEALLKLQKKYPNDPFLSDILLHRKLESIKETLEIETDPDGRVRCGYNLVGTETGRLTCYTSPTGSGANLQTITKKLRKLYRADDGMFLFQCDLSGADGWTVAARCLHHGDPTMWDDYTFGLKPAKILALMYMGVDVSRMSRPDLAALCKRESRPGGACDGDGWLYFSCKQTQHGTNYGMKVPTLITGIMKQSYKYTGTAIHIPVKDAETLQRLYLVRYRGLYDWHNWAKNQVASGANIKSASGHTRVFFGRRKSYNHKSRCDEADHDTWKEFLADEPQENTTYATNLAMHRLWTDSENRRGGLILPDAGDTIRATRRMESGGLFVAPSHSVHDALLGQFRAEDTTFATKKIREWFANELTIANTRVVIPFEGAYGPSWGQMGEKYGGGEI